MENAQKKAGTFDLGKALDDKGLKISNLSWDENKKPQYEVEDVSGEKYNLNVNDFIKGHLKDTGLSLDQLNVDYNTPSTAVNKSPVTLGDRLKGSWGNQKGFADYLKTKFDEVAIDENNGLTVKKDGIWAKVDAGGYGDASQYINDPWEFAADMADIARPALETAFNAAATAGGALAAGPVGYIAGSAVSNSINSLLNTSLGRYLGTYKATPQEEVTDHAIDIGVGMLGDMIPLGAGKILKKRVVESAAELAKVENPEIRTGLRLMAESLGGMGADTSETLAKRPLEVLAKSEAYERMAAETLKKGEDIGVQELAQGEMKGKLIDLIKAYPKKVMDSFGQMLDNIGSNPDIVKFQLDGLDLAENVVEPLKAVQVIGSKNVADLSSVTNKNVLNIDVKNILNKVMGKEVSDSQVNQLVKKLPYIEDLNKNLNLLNNSKAQLKGKLGFQVFRDVKLQLGDLIDDVSSMASKENPEARQILNSLKEAKSNLINSGVKSASDVGGDFAQKYGEMNKFYTNHYPAMSRAKDIERATTKGAGFNPLISEEFVKTRGKQIDNMVNNVLSNEAEDSRFVRQMSKLMGGSKIVKDFEINKAALELLGRTPNKLNYGSPVSGAVKSLISPLGRPATKGVAKLYRLPSKIDDALANNIKPVISAVRKNVAGLAPNDKELILNNYDAFLKMFGQLITPDDIKNAMGNKE